MKLPKLSECVKFSHEFLGYIYLKDGFVYASDARVLCKLTIPGVNLPRTGAVAINSSKWKAAEKFEFDRIEFREFCMVLKSGDIELLVPFENKLPERSFVVLDFLDKTSFDREPNKGVVLNVSLLKKVISLLGANVVFVHSDIHFVFKSDECIIVIMGRLS